MLAPRPAQEAPLDAPRPLRGPALRTARRPVPGQPSAPGRPVPQYGAYGTAPVPAYGQAAPSPAGPSALTPPSAPVYGQPTAPAYGGGYGYVPRPPVPGGLATGTIALAVTA